MIRIHALYLHVFPGSAAGAKPLICISLYKFPIATELLFALVNCTRKIRMMIVRNAQVQALRMTDDSRLHERLQKAQSLLPGPEPGLRYHVISIDRT